MLKQANEIWSFVVIVDVMKGLVCGVGMSKRLQSGGQVVMWDVITRQTLLV